MKVKLWYVIQDAGDGSAYIKWFRTEKGFEEYSEREDVCEGFAEFCGGSKEFEVDDKTGEIIPAKQKTWHSSFQEDRIEDDEE